MEMSLVMFQSCKETVSTGTKGNKKGEKEKGEKQGWECKFYTKNVGLFPGA
jgi:hypothetical protein